MITLTNGEGSTAIPQATSMAFLYHNAIEKLASPNARFRFRFPAGLRMTGEIQQCSVVAVQ
jgi:hypothetical protein